MKTVSLRYTDRFAPENGTIGAHRDILAHKGFVWYGKMGTPLSDKVSKMVLANTTPRILLIHSGSTERYWLYVDTISRSQPDYEEFPQYYHDISQNFKTWFRVIRIESADKGVMAKCKVVSSGASLSEVSRHSMSPYFVIEYDGQ